MSIEAMKQALEALQYPWKSQPHTVVNAIFALRAAIAEASGQDVQKEIEAPRVNQCAEVCERAKLCATCAQGLEEMGQEPVVWEAIEKIAQERYKVGPSDTSMFYRFAVLAGNGTQHLYIGREIDCQNMARKFAGAFLDGAFLYEKMATPPRRDWVSLTDEEVAAAWGEPASGSTLMVKNFARAIEAKLKEKNS